MRAVVLGLSLLLSVGVVAQAAKKKSSSKKMPAKAAAAKTPAATAQTTQTTKTAKPAQPDQPEVLFTFDDGPALDKTPKVLDILDQHKIKAVFFVNGWHFMGKKPSDEKAKELLREMHKRGHYVGNHTVHHYFLCGKVYSLRAASEIEDNAAMIEAAMGVRPELYRTPFGAHCPSLSATLAGLGVKHTGWDIDPQDWKVQNAAVIEQRVTSALKTLRRRAILLLHDVQGETVKALPKILDWLDAENAARAKDGRPQIKVLDYSYLLPKHELVPPLLDALGRVLIAHATHAGLDMQRTPLRLWPRLALGSGEV
jgi:peptidoglycan/xylan/chitin deacetylase (PgdA/CDA1 family)